MSACFYMTVGLPGCGKSTWTHSMGINVHSSDAMRIKLNTPPGDTSVFPLLTKDVRDDLKKGVSCIMDATNLSRKKRMAFLNEIKSCDCRRICVVFLVPVSVCRARNSKRTGFARVIEDVYDHMLRSYQLPSIYEGFDEIMYLSYGDKFDFTDEYPAGVAGLDPTALMDFDQCSIYHDHTLGEHLLYVADNIKSICDENGIDEKRTEMLYKTALHHDIGKAYTKDFHNGKGEPTENAHYYGHENYGTYIYLMKCLSEFNDRFPTVEQPRRDFCPEDPRCAGDFYIARLINWHMVPGNSWEKSAASEEKDRKLLSVEFPQLFDDIKLLHRADRMGH